MLPRHLRHLFTGLTLLVLGLVTGSAALVLAVQTPSHTDKSCGYQNEVSSVELSHSLDQESAWLKFLQATQAVNGKSSPTAEPTAAEPSNAGESFQQGTNPNLNTDSCTA